MADPSTFNNSALLPQPEIPISAEPYFGVQQYQNRPLYTGNDYGPSSLFQVNAGLRDPGFQPWSGGTPAPGTPLPAPGTPLNYPAPGTPYWRDNAAASGVDGPGLPRRIIGSAGNAVHGTMNAIGNIASGIGGGFMGIMNSFHPGTPINQANWLNFTNRTQQGLPFQGTNAFERSGSNFLSPQDLFHARSAADVNQMNNVTATGFGSNYTGTTQDAGHTIFNPSGGFIGHMVNGILEHGATTQTGFRVPPRSGSIASSAGRVPGRG